MRRVLPFRAFALGGLLLAGAVASGQKRADCDAKAPTDSSCAATPQAPKPAAPAAPAAQFPYPGDETGSASPSVPASKQFPYPTDAGAGAADAAAGSSSSSSSSSSSPSSAAGGGNGSAADPDDPLDPESATKQPPGRRKLPKVKSLQNDDDREAEDVKVAGFYFDQGNNLGAYNRLKDAVKLISDDPNAWFLLGEVAEKMNKPDESAEAYRKFLAFESGTRRAKTLAKLRPELRAVR